MQRTELSPGESAMVVVQTGGKARRVRMGGAEAAPDRGDVCAVVEQSGGRRQRLRHWHARVPVRSGDRGRDGALRGGAHAAALR